jgi:hypothetical protein
MTYNWTSSVVIKNASILRFMQNIIILRDIEVATYTINMQSRNWVHQGDIAYVVKVKSVVNDFF